MLFICDDHQLNDTDKVEVEEKLIIYIRTWKGNSLTKHKKLYLHIWKHSKQI